MRKSLSNASLLLVFLIICSVYSSPTLGMQVYESISSYGTVNYSTTPTTSSGVAIGAFLASTTTAEVTAWKTATGKGVYLLCHFAQFIDLSPILSKAKPICDAGLAAGVEITWGPWIGNVMETTTVTKVANGDYDALITTVAQEFAAFPYVKLMSFGGEMNGNWVGYGYDSTVFKNAWIRVWNIFHSNNAGVQFIWQPSETNVPLNDPTHGAFSGRDTMINYYPGDSYVDFWGPSIYVYSDFALKSTISQRLTPYLSATSKPFWFAECSGYDHYYNPYFNIPASYAAQWTTDFLTFMAQHSDRIKGFDWYDADYLSGYLTPAAPSEILTAYKQAIANSVFIDASSV